MRTFFKRLLLVAVLVSVPELRLHAELADGIQVIVSDALVTYQQVEVFTAQTEDYLRKEYRTRPAEYQRQMGRMVTNAMDTLLQRELILHDFHTSGFNIPESIIDEYVQDKIHEKFSDRVAFTKQLQEEGMSYETFRKQVRDTLIIKEMTHKFVPEPIISPHKIEVYYQEHLEDYKVADQVKTRIIVLNQLTSDEAGAAKKRAEEILLQIKGGAAFAEMATVYSDGSGRAQGGENGWQEVKVLNTALVEPLAKLKPGEYTEVIETPQACFLVLLEERQAAHNKPLAELRDEIENTLMIRESSRLQQKWIDRLKKKTFVRYF
ncbi:MAG: Peptidylprolyl isomerase [Pedosphaera sp.]|nr:Peptidylprolyl isomerase [Pedosphaera sp.]